MPDKLAPARSARPDSAAPGPTKQGEAREQLSRLVSLTEAEARGGSRKWAKKYLREAAELAKDEPTAVTTHLRTRLRRLSKQLTSGSGKGSGSVWTVSGGLPGLGKRR
jgi:hypothetical protein